MISIAMATYNGEKYIKDQIDSILNQTYKDFELIICDDCSSDNTRKILKDYEQKDKRIKLVFNISNLGYLKNFEHSISFCSGDFIAFSDQDDIWEPYKLQRSLSLIGNNDIYCSSALLVTADNKAMKGGLLKKTFPKDNITLSKYLLSFNCCQGATILAKRQFIINNLPIPDVFIYHDYYFAFAASLNNGIFYDKKYTLRYRQHGSNLTINKPSNFVKDLVNTNYMNLENRYIAEDNRLTFIIEHSEKYPLWLIKYAKELKIYNEKMFYNKNFWTLKFFIKNYKYLSLDNNFFHKYLIILKRFCGVLKFKYSKKHDKK